MQAELLTILTPTYNGISFCKSWCDSISQWSDDLRAKVKFIVIDNLSSDGTMDYLKSNLPCRAEFHRIKSSVEEALHLGMSLVESPFTTMLSLDDKLFESYILESTNKPRPRD